MPTTNSVGPDQISGEAVVYRSEPPILRVAMEALFHASPDPAFVVDSRSVILHVSDSASRLFGLRPAELAGKTFADLAATPEAAAVFAAQTDRVILAKQPITAAALILTATGTRWYESRLVPVSDDHEAVVAVFCIARDMTDCPGWIAEQAVIDSSASAAPAPQSEQTNRYRLIVENAHEGIWLVAEDTTIEYVNPCMAEMLGYACDEMVGRNAFDFVFPEDVTRYQQVYGTRKESVSQQVEVRLRRKDGTELWTLANSNPIIDGEGRFIGALALVTDLTERRRQEQEIAALNRRLGHHFENTPLAVIEWDEQMCVRHWSAGAERVFGWKPAEVMGKYFENLRFIHESDAAATRDVVRRLVDGSEQRNVSFNRNYTSSGELLECEWYNSVLQSDDGKHCTVLSLVLDVTDRRRIQARLIQAQKMESIGRLAGGLAHEYNNVLAVILGYAELVEEGLEGDDEVLANVRNINEAANRAATLTRQLLGFARRQPSHPQVVSPDDLLLDFCELLHTLLKADVELVFIPGGNTGNVEIDPTHLEQIVLYLALHAHEAMPQGGTLIIQTDHVGLVEPRLTERVIVARGDYARISITDTGPGVTEEVRQNLFEPYFATRLHGSGAGLGLATVYGLVKQARGYIFAHSEVGIGTTFDIYLPRSGVQVPSTAVFEPSAVKCGGDVVLVVDDEPLVRRLTCGALQRAGYTVLVAENGAEALEVLETYGKTVSLVVTDAIMPLMGGRKLIEHLRANWSHVRILLVSGYREEGFTAQSTLPHGVAFLQKPFTSRALLATVERTLNG